MARKGPAARGDMAPPIAAVVERGTQARAEGSLAVEPAARADTTTATVQVPGAVGGAGYYGGGGGGAGSSFENDCSAAGGGGGGGSSYAEPSATSVRFWQGWKNRKPNGLVVFTW